MILTRELQALVSELEPHFPMLQESLAAYQDDSEPSQEITPELVVRVLQSGCEIYIESHPSGVQVAANSGVITVGNDRICQLKIYNVSPEVLRTVCGALLEKTPKLRVAIPESLTKEIEACRQSDFEVAGRLRNETLIRGQLQDKILLERLHPRYSQRWHEKAQKLSRSTVGQEVSIDVPAPNEPDATSMVGSVESPGSTATDEHLRDNELHEPGGIFCESGVPIAQLPPIRLLDGSEPRDSREAELYAEYG